MVYLQLPRLDNFSPCPYLKNRKSRIEFFFAADLSPTEFNGFLASGWRRFGYFFFRPRCGECRECVPIRIIVDSFEPSRSQRRILRKNSDLEALYVELGYRDEIFQIYAEHSRDRFAQEAEKEHFVQSFYPRAVPALQGEYYFKNELMAAGFLDRSSKALSSVYFFYKTAFNPFSPGTCSVLREIELTRQSGLLYYYLGYYIKDNRSMAYKNRFKPYELFDWETETWSRPEV